jgi:beta-lactamase class A
VFCYNFSVKIKIFLLLFILLVLSSAILLIRTTPKINLHQTILSALSGARGKYSVVVKDLKNNKTESVYGDKIFEAGSLYKLWVMAEAFRQIKDGTLSKDEVLSEDVSVLNQDFGIDPETAELTGGTVTLTVSGALKQMIDISHNYAALLLTKRIKLSSVAKFLQTYGFKNSQLGDTPTSNADDIALFFEKLYKGELNNQQYTKEMLDLLKGQQLNDKLPKYLPKGTVIAHKTGEIDYLSHDGGIVYVKNGDYVIVVLSDSDYPPGAEERIARISKSVFDYFSDDLDKKTN